MYTVQYRKRGHPTLRPKKFNPRDLANFAMYVVCIAVHCLSFRRTKYL